MQTDFIIPLPPEALLSHRQRPDCLIYHFCGEAIKSSEVPIEARILQSIEANHTGLSLFRTEGIVKGEFFTEKKSTVYRLQHGSTRADFAFLNHNGQTVADIIMLFTDPREQGRYFLLKRWVLNRLVLTLFGIDGVAMILGTASPNTMPVRKKPNSWRDWRTEEALVKLYQHLGFSRVPGSNEVFLTKEAFEAASTMPRLGSRLASGASRQAGERSTPPA